MMMFDVNATSLITVASGVIIPLIIGFITYQIAKRQIIGAGVTHFRQNWINDLRNSISVFIAKAEMIAMLEYDEADLYFEYFEELSRMHAKIELMLNPNEVDHNKLLNVVGEIRDLIHREGISEKKLEKRLDSKIADLLAISKSVLKREWEVVKAGR